MMNEIDNWVENALLGFIADPPDSDHQRGYLACLLVVCDETSVAVDDDILEQAKAL